MMTGFAVLKIVLMPSKQRLASFANSGPRWSMIARSMARRMRSGSGDGPGIWRKWRPATREAFLAIVFVLEFCEIEKFGRGPVTRNCTPHNLRAEMRRRKIACNYYGLEAPQRLPRLEMIAFIYGRCN